jgi:hypothetical protein
VLAHDLPHCVPGLTLHPGDAKITTTTTVFSLHSLGAQRCGEESLEIPSRG